MLRIANISTYLREQRTWESRLLLGLTILEAIGALYTARHFRARPTRPLIFSGLALATFSLSRHVNVLPAYDLPLDVLKVYAADNVSSFSLGSKGEVVYAPTEASSSFLNPCKRVIWTESAPSEMDLEWANLCEVRHLVGPFADGTFAGADRYSSVLVWNDSGQLVGRYYNIPDYHRESSALNYNPNTQTVATGTYEGYGYSWSLAGGYLRNCKMTQPISECIRWIGFSQDSQNLTYLATDHQLYVNDCILCTSGNSVWDMTETSQVVGVITHENQYQVTLFKSPPESHTHIGTCDAPTALTCTANQVFVATQTGRMAIFNLKTNESRTITLLMGAMKKQIPFIDQIAYDAQHKLIITTDYYTGGLQFWRQEDGKLMGALDKVCDFYFRSRLLVNPARTVIQVAQSHKNTLHCRMVAY